MITRLFSNPTLLLILTMLMWACNAISGQLAVGHVTPYTLVLMRWVMVVAVLWPICGREVIAHWPLIRSKLGPLILMSFAGFTGFNTLFYVASVHTTGLNIGILQGSMPVLVMIGAFLVYGARVTALQMVGVATTLVGVAIVASRGDLDVLLDLAFNYGDLLMLVAAFIYGAYSAALQAKPDIHWVSMLAVMAVSAAVISVPAVAYEAATGALIFPTTLQGWGVVWFTAIFPAMLAQGLFIKAVGIMGPNRAGLFLNLVPIFGALLAVVILGEAFHLYHALALTLVIGGIFLAQKLAPKSKG